MPEAEPSNPSITHRHSDKKHASRQAKKKVFSDTFQSTKILGNPGRCVAARKDPCQALKGIDWIYMENSVKKILGSQARCSSMDSLIRIPMLFSNAAVLK